VKRRFRPAGRERRLKGQEHQQHRTTAKVRISIRRITPSLASLPPLEASRINHDGRKVVPHTEGLVRTTTVVLQIVA
jgi:hypothetical protein